MSDLSDEIQKFGEAMDNALKELGEVIESICSQLAASDDKDTS